MQDFSPPSRGIMRREMIPMGHRQIHKIKNSAGFTLIEILMTIMIMGILGAVAMVSFIDYGKEAKLSVTQKRLAEFKVAISGDPQLVVNGEYIKQGFIADNGSLPTSLNDLVTQGSYPAYSYITKRGWRGPYVDSTVSGWNQDAWGTTFSYSATSRTVTSCGPDTICGGANAADDISISF